MLYCSLQARDVGDLISWKSLVSTQLDDLLRDNFVLRLLLFLSNIVPQCLYIIILKCLQCLAVVNCF